MDKHEIRGVTIVGITSGRIGKAERKPGYHYYSVRHCDEDGFTPATIEPAVWVNHMFDLVTEKPFDFGQGQAIELTDEEAEIVLSAPYY